MNSVFDASNEAQEDIVKLSNELEKKLMKVHCDFVLKKKDSNDLKIIVSAVINAFLKCSATTFSSAFFLKNPVDNLEDLEDCIDEVLVMLKIQIINGHSLLKKIEKERKSNGKKERKSNGK